MFIKLPVHCNVGLAVNDPVGQTAYLSPGSVTTSPPIPRAWQHPGFCTDSRRMIAAVARSRKLINRQTASSVCEDALDTDVFSVLTHVSRLSSKWNLIGYTLDPTQIRAELVTRGPVVAAIPVRQSLLTHISSLMDGATSTYEPGSDPELGLVSVAVLGWDDAGWVVALPWGKFSKSMSEHAWDGCVRVPSVVNACAMCNPSDLKPSPTGFEVKIMPTSWNPPTTRPLPANTESSRTSGKVKHLNKPDHLEAFRAKFTDDNVTLVLKCLITTTIIVLAVLTLVMMKTRKH